jgi:MFS family permease
MHEQPKGKWGELFHGRTGAYTAFILLGTVLYSIQMLAMVTVMPTVIQDIGGGAYYVWATMLFGVGTVIGAASVGPAWSAVGGRRLFLAAGLVYAAGTLACALAADMLVLVVARAVQGYGGGLIIAGSMGIISRWYPAAQRTRILSVYQGAWTACSLLGPLVGGAFAELGWWRGIFWALVPVALAFFAMAWAMLPHDVPRGQRPPRLPLLRLGLLGLGVTGIAEAGQLQSNTAQVALMVASVAITWSAFPLDARASHRLFPSRPLSITRAVGLGYWILLIAGIVQGAVTIFLPLTLQVVHEVTPLLVGMPYLVLSIAWTGASFWVANWSGARERLAMRSGPILMLAGLAAMLAGVHGASVTLLMAGCFLLGFGIGIHNVHLSARVMEAAADGEEAITASSMSMIRPLGMAVGTAAAGLIGNVAGLGEQMDKAVVSVAVSAVLVFSIVPLLFAQAFIVRLSRLVVKMGAREAVRTKS